MVLAASFWAAVVTGGIGMQGEPHAEVPQHPGYRLDIYPVLEGQRCECMP